MTASSVTKTASLLQGVWVFHIHNVHEETVYNTQNMRRKCHLCDRCLSSVAPLN